jgi:hypothetical protein
VGDLFRKKRRPYFQKTGAVFAPRIPVVQINDDEAEKNHPALLCNRSSVGTGRNDSPALHGM